MGPGRRCERTPISESRSGRISPARHEMRAGSARNRQARRRLWTSARTRRPALLFSMVHAPPARHASISGRRGEETGVGGTDSSRMRGAARSSCRRCRPRSRPRRCRPRHPTTKLPLSRPPGVPRISRRAPAAAAHRVAHHAPDEDDHHQRDEDRQDQWQCEQAEQAEQAGQRQRQQRPGSDDVNSLGEVATSARWAVATSASYSWPRMTSWTSSRRAAEWRCHPRWPARPGPRPWRPGRR